MNAAPLPATHWPTTSLTTRQTGKAGSMRASMHRLAGVVLTLAAAQLPGLAVHGQSKAANYVPPLVRPPGPRNSRGARPLPAAVGPGDGVFARDVGPPREARRTGPNGS